MNKTKKKPPAPPKTATNIFADPSAQAVKEELALVSFDFTSEEAETLLGKWYDKAVAQLKKESRKRRYLPAPLTIAKRILRLEVRGGQTPNGLFDQRWADAINQVLEDRGVNITISDLEPQLWDDHIGPMIDAIEESVLNMADRPALVILDTIGCAKCGTIVSQKKVIVDQGEDEEEGNIFYYCSTDCRDRH